MGRGDQTDINLVCAVTAQPLKFLLLQHAQQFRLTFHRDVADFIKKERALIREFKTSRLLRYCSCEGSFFVAKQLALQKPKWNRSAIQFDKGAFPSAAQIVDCTRNKLFTGSCFAL